MFKNQPSENRFVAYAVKGEKDIETPGYIIYTAEFDNMELCTVKDPYEFDFNARVEPYFNIYRGEDKVLMYYFSKYSKYQVLGDIYDYKHDRNTGFQLIRASEDHVCFIINRDGPKHGITAELTETHTQDIRHLIPGSCSIKEIEGVYSCEDFNGRCSDRILKDEEGNWKEYETCSEVNRYHPENKRFIDQEEGIDENSCINSECCVDYNKEGGIVRYEDITQGLVSREEEMSTCSYAGGKCSDKILTDNTGRFIPIKSCDEVSARDSLLRRFLDEGKADCELGQCCIIDSETRQWGRVSDSREAKALEYVTCEEIGGACSDRILEDNQGNFIDFKTCDEVNDKDSIQERLIFPAHWGSIGTEYSSEHTSVKDCDSTECCVAYYGNKDGFYTHELRLLEEVETAISEDYS
ncbi:hypothetical protein GF345_06625 [Candidatus Woesearchaeota archaeon]|nr:hypothetical protein [Candidatus Woesearchaeota archaeon]